MSKKGFSAKRETKGFTLIELLVVVSIVAVLATVGIMMYVKAQSTARDSRRKQDFTSLKGALELYYNRNGYFPTSDSTQIPMPETTYKQHTTSEWDSTSTGFKKIMVTDSPGYINQLPRDPNCQTISTSCTYYYVYHSTDGYSYELGTRLENSLDTNTCSAGLLAGLSTCNYQVTN